MLQIESPRSLQPVMGSPAGPGGPFPMGLPAAVPAPLTPPKLPTGPAGPTWTPRAVPVALSPAQQPQQQGSASPSAVPVARSPPSAPPQVRVPLCARGLSPCVLLWVQALILGTSAVMLDRTIRR